MKSIHLFWFLSVFLAAGTCVAQNNPVPLIEQPLVPAAAAPAGPGFTLTVHGAGFVSGSIVNWNGIPLVTTFESASNLTAVVPAANVALSGTASVTVFNPVPGGGSSDPASFSITHPASSLVFRSLSVSGATTPMNVLSADFNHDGIPDLAVIDHAPAPSCNYQFSGTGSIAILQGNGDGTFFKSSTLCLIDLFETEPTALALAGDLNRDGNVDLITVSNLMSDGEIAAYYGNGDGTFSAPQELGPSSFPSAMAATKFASTNLFQHITGIALGDFYRNGQLNVAVSKIDDFGASQLYLLPEENFLFFNPANPSTGALSTGDFNGDGIPDLVDTSGSLLTFLDNGSGTFSEEPDTAFGDFGSVIANGDFNGDGIADLAAVHGNTIAVLLGNGDGTFTPKTGQPVSAQTNVSLIEADFNGDGKLDLAVVDSTGVVSIWLGNGDGTFQSPVDTTGRGDGIAAGDYNGDGQMDLAVTNSTTGAISILLQGSPYKAFVEGPIDPEGTSTFSGKRVSLPVRFTLTENGTPTCTMPAATISVMRTEGKTTGPVSEQVYGTRADNGSNFRIDRSTCQYVYHLATESMGVGKYSVDINIDGTSVGEADFTLSAIRHR